MKNRPDFSIVVIELYLLFILIAIVIVISIDSLIGW